MCLIVIANKTHPRYELVMAGNRDEYYERPTAPLDYWEDNPRVLAGRDLRGMGTWLGITPEGRFAAVTNYREGTVPMKPGPSRGDLVREFLTGDVPPREYMEGVSRRAGEYSGFNLLAGDAGSLCYFSNRGSGVRVLPPGVYGLSNHLLDTPWPKVRRAVSAFEALTAAGGEISIQDVIGILASREAAADEALPDTGFGLAWERVLAPAFITSPAYGTRSSSVLLIGRSGEIVFHEQGWQPARSEPVPAGERTFRLNRRVKSEQ